MLLLAIKKIVKNKWLMLALFSGILLSVIIACTIPIYSAGISQRMLITQLQNYQRNEDVHPGTLRISASLFTFKKAMMEESYEVGAKAFNDELVPSLKMPPQVRSACIFTNTIVMSDVRYNEVPFKDRRSSNIVIKALDNYDNSVKLTEGRLPFALPDDKGYMEVMISKYTQQNLKILIGNEFEVEKGQTFTSGAERIAKVKVVGVFDYSDNPNSGLSEIDTGIELYGNFDLVYKELMVNKQVISNATWYYVGDYTSLRPADMKDYYNSLVDMQQWIKKWDLTKYTTMPPISAVEEFNNSYSSVQLLLLLFYLPIMMLLILFIFMITKLVVDNDKNELSVLRSRGASKWQLLFVYLIQSGIMAGLSLLVAPYIAFLLCRLLGATSGFMEFGQRSPIVLSINASTYLYGIIAALLVVLTMTIPALMASGIEIVEQKLLKAQNKYVPLWKKLYLDIVLLLVSCYGYFTYINKDVATANGAAGSITLEPLTFLLIMFFLMGIGLLFLRIYPMLLMLLFKLTRKKLNPPLYSGLTRVGRMQGREQFLIIFLVLTIALGFFNANSARTMNVNMNERVLYKGGADMVATVSFDAIKGSNAEDGTIQKPFLFNDLKGVTSATKVIVGKTPTASFSGRPITDLDFMGIVPNQFANSVWWRNGISQEHLNTYLNMLNRNPMGCIISTNMQEMLSANVGDTINVTLEPASKTNTRKVALRVLAVVDEWPTYFPTKVDSKGETVDNYLMVANVLGIETRQQNLDYQAWLKTDGNITGAELKKTMQLRGIVVTKVDNTKAAYENSQNSALRQATNGSLTLGFLVVMIICIIGFVIYWVLAIRSRVLQIGTMRALGMPVRQVYQMIFWEQLLLSGVALFIGIILGGAASDLFIPVLQSTFGAAEQLPAFRIVTASADFIKIYAFIGVLLSVGMILAYVLLKQIKAAAAIKLGEE